MAEPYRFELELLEDVEEETEYKDESLGASSQENGARIPPSLSNSLAGTAGFTDENGYQSQSSSVPTSSCTHTAIKRPSYYNLQGNTGLYPAACHFDMNVVKKLDTFFDETVTDILEDEKLKTFLRIRPSTSYSLGPKSRSFKAQNNKVLPFLSQLVYVKEGFAKLPLANYLKSAMFSISGVRSKGPHDSSHFSNSKDCKLFRRWSPNTHGT